MKLKKTTISVKYPREIRPIRIVNDAGISTRGVFGGKMLPLLLLDTSNRPDVEEFIRIHQALGPGDVTFQWAQIEDHDDTVALLLRCIRPVEVSMLLEFEIVRQGFLVDQALRGGGMYIARAEGQDDRWIMNPDRPHVCVELGVTGFEDAWEDMFHKHVEKDFRRNGMGRAEARRAARMHIKEMRELGGLRMRDVHA